MPLQILSPSTVEDAYLHVPPVERQFLISPPASPPVGWEQPKEDKPVVDYDLLSAMASLSPGKLLILLFPLDTLLLASLALLKVFFLYVVPQIDVFFATTNSCRLKNFCYTFCRVKRLFLFSLGSSL